MAEELQGILRQGGIKAVIVPGPGTVREEILIESSQETAAMALSLQTAFLGAGMRTQVLVHRKERPRVVIVHLGAPAFPKAKAS
jgi:hypothetical protein